MPGATIVVVEDSILQQIVLEKRLRPTFTPRFAATVMQGCALLDTCAFERAPPRLVLSDDTLPDGDGLAVLGHAKRLFAHVPRVFMSGSAPSNVDLEAAVGLVTLFVRKPVRLQELLLLCALKPSDDDGPGGR